MKKDIHYVVWEIEGKEQSMDVKASSKERAMVFITADSLQSVLTMMGEGREAALIAMANWEPEMREELPKEPQEHFVCSGKSVEAMAADAAEYEASPAGQRLIKRIRNAHEFISKHAPNGCGLYVPELGYLSDKYQNSLINGSMDLYVLGYRLGFRHGKAEAEKKAGRKV